MNFTATIDGLPVAGERLPLQVVNPATAQVFAEAPNLSLEQLDAAVDAASRAFVTWRQQPIAERRQVVLRIADALREHAAQIAELLTREQGKPLVDASAEVNRAVTWTEGLAELEWDDHATIDDGSRTVDVQYAPLGVVGALVPWNFPISLSFWKIAAALITGNTVVLKPSPFTPLTALLVGEILRDVVPSGVLNVISGEDDLGPAMTTHPGIAKIAFTGSSATGRKVMESAAGTLKRITLELGGNDAAIVLPDVDVDELAPKLFWASFVNTGQACLATKRVYAHRDVRERLLRALAEYAATVRIGDGLEPGTQLGPVQNRVQYEKVLEFYSETEREGYSVAYRGTVPDRPGYFIAPMIVDRPPENSPLVQEEPFGPILPVLEFEDDDDVIARVNAGPYGLGATIWTGDIERARRLAARIDAGVVSINEMHRLSPNVPLSGHKQSGFGGENGVEGLMEYVATRIVAVAQ